MVKTRGVKLDFSSMTNGGKSDELEVSYFYFYKYDR